MNPSLAHILPVYFESAKHCATAADVAPPSSASFLARSAHPMSAASTSALPTPRFLARSLQTISHIFYREKWKIKALFVSPGGHDEDVEEPSILSSFGQTDPLALRRHRRAAAVGANLDKKIISWARLAFPYDIWKIIVHVIEERKEPLQLLWHPIALPLGGCLLLFLPIGLFKIIILLWKIT